MKKPELLQDFGDMTIADVWEVVDGAEHNRLVGEWALEVWKAFGDYHGLTRGWIEMAKR